MSDNRNNNVENRQQQVLFVSRDRSLFVAKAYTLATIFLAISCMQLLLAVLIDDFRNFLQENLYIGFMGLVFYFLAVFILMNFRDIRIAPMYNLGLTLVLVEALTAALMTLSVFFKKKDVFKAYALAITTSVSFILMTSCCPCDAVLCIPFLVLVSCFDFLFVLIIVILIIWMPSPIHITIFASVTLVTSVIYLIYHTLIICGGKIEITSDDPYNGGIITFIDVTGIYILILLLHYPSGGLLNSH